uniref:Uncharacterized protein n=1 Tax=Polytomella parva TaxID=51329 RepID=A0A7S0UUP6_9CHLO
MKLTNFVIISDCNPIIKQITQGDPSDRFRKLYPGISSIMRDFPSTFNKDCLMFKHGAHVQDAHDICGQILDEVSRSIQNAAKQFRERFKNSAPLPKLVNGEKKREIRDVTKIKK